MGIEAREELVCERCGRSADAEARFCSFAEAFAPERRRCSRPRRCALLA